MRSPARALVAVLAAAVLLALPACGAIPKATDAAPAPSETRVPLSQLSVLDDPRAYVGASTARLADTSIVPVAAHPDQALPATVVSHDRGGDVSVTVADTSRVVAMDLAGSLAATVWGLGLGSTLVGVDQSATFPEARDLPKVTSGGHSVNTEALIALRPTLVLTDGTVGPRDVVEQLRDVGILVVFVTNTASFDGAQQLARDVAAVYGAPQAGERLAERIDSEITQVRSDIAALVPAEPDRRLRMVFLYLRGSAGVYYLFGTEAGADTLIDALGGVDVAAERGWGEMVPLTDEAMVAADPDLILVMSKGLESVGGVDALLAERPAIAMTRAGEHRRFVDMDDGTVLSFGPRSAGVLDALARAVYAPTAP